MFSMFSTSTSRRNSSGYRSARSVRRQHTDSGLRAKLSTFNLMLIFIGLFVLSMTTILPMILLETSTSNNGHAPSSLQNVLTKSEEELRNLIGKQRNNDNDVKKADKRTEKIPKEKASLPLLVPKENQKKTSRNDPLNNKTATAKTKSKNQKQKASNDPLKNETATAKTRSRNKNKSNKNEENKQQHKILARGVSGLPMSQTPALEGAEWGHVECDVNVDDMAYWNDPQGTRDQNFLSPFSMQDIDEQQHQPNGSKNRQRRYLTFEPDPGGWNNIRMSMEIIFAIAAATGRTLVLPPKAPFYLLGMGEKNARSFGSFYDLSKAAFQKEFEVISTEEFFEREVFPKRNTKEQGLLDFLTDEEVRQLQKNETLKMCLYREGAGNHCENLYKHLRKAGYQPPLESSSNCFVFDQDAFLGQEVTFDLKERADRFCGEERTPVYYNQTIHEPQLIHWDASKVDARAGGHRLLNHFYSFLFFTDPVVDNHYKRFVRDFLHYKDSPYCAAGKIVHALNNEGEWSSLHVRRGDLQYKEVKIPAQEWYANLKEIWNEGETLFIATDERNKTFFDPIKEHHNIRFLDDYWDVGKLGDIDPYFLGMVDTIIASHGRTFAGTWFSTFTGYIDRMRGYLGYSIKDSWYGWLPRKDVAREYKFPVGNYQAREWPIGWMAIDGDLVIEHEGIPVLEVEDGGGSAVFQRKLPPVIKISELKTDETFKLKPAKRALAGRSEKYTPAIGGASRGSIKCDVNVDSMAYWNDPQGTIDQEFVTPFLSEGTDEKYITFSTDRGGWNNVRMSMEIIFVIAAATGRTLVLPPKEPLYRLAADKNHKQRGFADFFPLGTPKFAKKVKTITTAEFIKREGGPGGRVPIPVGMRENVTNSAEVCEHRKKSNRACDHVTEYLNNAGYVPDVDSHSCMIFDKDLYAGNPRTNNSESSIASFCGSRKRFPWTSEVNNLTLIHFRANDKQWRLLAHFYNAIHFTEPLIDNYFKRFVRDFLHYNDQIYCAAGKIVKALQVEGSQRGFNLDEEGGGRFSAMHIRRGDFQYKKVKISAEKWYDNTKEVWKPNEIIYIATDERDKSFFGPIAKHHDIRFLDDYWDLASLGDIDPNYFGMIDTIVSSRARAFAGTWFSTFTGYINRMRGYHGMSMKDSYYSFLDKKTRLHTWENMNSSAYAFEWPDGWIGIDTNIRPEKTDF
mmetsp:Transcript_38921/g.44490  ORF Transcript_38921/g.44490 Transcript_38921/m.44490 type:complete len:1187 (+) Transcript_38921:96-3656(+)